MSVVVALAVVAVAVVVVYSVSSLESAYSDSQYVNK